MDKEEMEKILREMQIEKRVEKKVRYHCIAFWSLASSLVGVVGMWAGEHVDAATTGVVAFIEALKQE